MSRPIICITVAAASLLSFALLLGISQPVKPSAPAKSAPLPIGEPPLVYAVLTKSTTGSFPPSPTSPGSQYKWEFTDGVRPITDAALLAKLNIRPGAIFDDASMVNAIANLGYDLLSHSERAASTVPSMNGGNSSSGDMSIVEHWWFKRH